MSKPRLREAIKKAILEAQLVLCTKSYLECHDCEYRLGDSYFCLKSPKIFQDEIKKLRVMITRKAEVPERYRFLSSSYVNLLKIMLQLLQKQQVVKVGHRKIKAVSTKMIAKEAIEANIYSNEGNVRRALLNLRERGFVEQVKHGYYTLTNDGIELARVKEFSDIFQIIQEKRAIELIKYYLER